MIAGLPLSFAEPFLLLGLLSLPVLWWLLRVMPPRPRRVEFPPTRLLFDIAPKEETPSRTPWWLTLLRLTAAALVILAAAGPIWNPQTALGGSKAPLVILLDDGWSAAAASRNAVSHHGVRDGVSSFGAMSNNSRVGGNSIRRGRGGITRNNHHNTGRLNRPSSRKGSAKVSGSPAIMRSAPL